MKLQGKEIVQLEEIISEYKEIYKKIEIKQQEMLKLESDVEFLLKELADNRDKENAFGKKLEKEYGKGKFNILNREYELDN